MSVRVCARFARGLSASVLYGNNALSAGPERASWFLTAGNRGERRNGFIFTPSRFISSKVFLNRLINSKLAEADGSVYALPASVPPDSGEQMSLLLSPPDQPDNPKILRVAIIGAPNAGKSTLSNQLLNRKVFAVSKKVHTTRSRALGVTTENDTQIILLDTPGLIAASTAKRYNLEKSLLMDPWRTVKEADLIVVVVDVADRWKCNRLDFELLKCLSQNTDIPAILVLNKVDLVKNKEKLLDTTAVLTCGIVNGNKIQVRSVIKPPWAEKTPERDPLESPTDEQCPASHSDLAQDQLKALWKQDGWPHFKDVFMLSSVDPEDVETLKDYFLVAAQPGPWRYHSQVLTDQTPEEICTNIIREKMLELLPEEVPYTTTQVIELWQEGEDETLHISVKLCTKKESQMRLMIGTAGKTVAAVAEKATEDLTLVFLRDVRLKLGVKLIK